jgi:sn-glycerol 3-phosphate transport system substrate-binding protein
MIRFVSTLAVTALLATSAQAATEITWWHAMGGKLGETVNSIVGEYNGSQDACHLEATYKGGYEETMTAGIAAFRAKQSPNIIQIFDAGSATIVAAKGAVYPVAQLLNENGVAFNKEDYIPGVRYFYADNDGQMIGMPFNSSTPVMYYNKAALAEAGVAPPKTWEEFETVAAPKLAEKGYIALAQSHGPWIWSENFMSRHNLPMSDMNNGYDGPATKIGYNNEDLRMHFHKLKEWKDKGWYGHYGAKWDDNKVPFEKKEVAMWIGSSGSFGGLKDTTDFEFGTAGLPYWKSIVSGEPLHTFIGGAALFTFAGHDKAQNECVAKFFAHLTKPETQYFWHKETGYVPVTTAAYELAKKDGYYDREPDAEVGILQLSEASAEWNKGYRLGFYPQIREVLYREYDKIFNGDVTVEEAFNTIEEESNQLLERFAKTSGM